MTEIRIENINKSFEKNRVLKNITLSAQGGEFISVLGPSGCGKTTLLRIIAGLVPQDSGSVFIGNELSDAVPARKRGAVIVFQDSGLFPHMTAKQNIDFGLAAKKIIRPERDKMIRDMLEVMQISDKAGFYPHELSGGQKQRVALARACVLEPRLLLLDEPFSALDQGLRDGMREFVSNLQSSLGITTVLVTHDKEEAFMLSKRVAVIIDGNLLQYDTPERIYANPKTIEVSDFIGQANYIEGKVDKGRFSCMFGEYDFLESTEGRAKLMLRYDQLIISQTDGIPGTVKSKKFKGHFITYTMTVFDKKEAASRELKINSTNSSYAPGQSLFVKPAKDAGCILL